MIDAETGFLIIADGETDLVSRQHLFFQRLVLLDGGRVVLPRLLHPRLEILHVTGVVGRDGLPVLNSRTRD